MTAPGVPAATARILVVAAAASIIFLLVPPAAHAACDAMRDVQVQEDVGQTQPNGAKLFTVEVSNGAAVPVSGIHLNCGYNFRAMLRPDPSVIALVAHGDCLLLRGGAIAPGSSVSFTYTNYVRYDVKLIAATCNGSAAASDTNDHRLRL